MKLQRCGNIDGYGALAQLGERYNGIVEVSGSIPLGSTINHICRVIPARWLTRFRPPAFFAFDRIGMMQPGREVWAGYRQRSAQNHVR